MSLDICPSFEKSFLSSNSAGSTTLILSHWPSAHQPLPCLRTLWGRPFQEDKDLLKGRVFVLMRIPLYRPRQNLVLVIQTVADHPEWSMLVKGA
jgi:hypothetical protein